MSSHRRYLATIPWPDSAINEPSYTQADISSIIEILRNHGSRLSRIEERLEEIVTNGRSPRILSDDPPCEICGRWTTNGRLCPECERKYPWF